MNGTARIAARPSLLVAALAGTTGLYLALLALAYTNAGVFEYPIDDVYIHLAMAEQLAQGGYGVNAGEFASASSSPLYSLLLAPFSGSEFHRYLPLAWNAAAITVSGVALAAILTRATATASLTAPIAFTVTFLLALTLHLSAIAATGMEHALHAAVSLLLLLGLIDFLRERRVRTILVAAIVLGPMLRFEALALSLLACAVIGLHARPALALGLALAAIIPLGLFMLALTSIGLDPLPSSVLVKLQLVGNDAGPVARALARLASNLAQPPGLALAVLGGVSLLAGFASGSREGVVLAMVLAAAIVAHLAFGRIGWMDRYENYILAVAGAGAVYLALNMHAKSLGFVLAIAALLMLSANFYRYAAGHLRWNQYAAASVYLQHAQMARFAREFVDVPVAVNDLGRVAYRNPNYVLDLWGLASAEARETRLDPARAPGWADPLARDRDVKLAMIYDRYLSDAPGAGWVRLGTLEHLANQGMLADREVAFYATDDAYAADLRSALEKFVPTLPEGVRFTFADGSGVTEEN